MGRTNRTQEAWVYSSNGPIRRRKRGYILLTDQSDASMASSPPPPPNPHPSPSPEAANSLASVRSIRP
eukprot:980784-Prorocentrum_minimum.AAC.1